MLPNFTGESGRVVQLAEQTAVTNPAVMVPGSSPGPPTNHQQDNRMKKLSEKYVENALKMLHDTLLRNITDISAVLDMYEMTHDDYELCYNKPYNALSAGWYAIQEAVSKMNNQLNKK